MRGLSENPKKLLKIKKEGNPMKRLKFVLLFLAVFAFLISPAIAKTPSTTSKNFWTARQIVKNGFTVDNMPLDIYLPMAGWAVDGGDDIDDTETPDLTDGNNIPLIDWESGETTAIQQTFRLPGASWTQATSLVFYVIISSDTDLDAAAGVDWRIWVNRTGVVFDAVAIEQTVVTASSAGDLDTTNEVLTLTCNATCLDAIQAGDFITLDLFAAVAGGTVELKGAHGIFRARQKF